MPKTNRPKKIFLSVRLHPDVWTRLQVQAAAHAATVSDEASEAIAVHCTSGQDQHRTATHKRFCEIRRAFAEAVATDSGNALKACDVAEEALHAAGFPVFREHSIGLLGWIERYWPPDGMERLAEDERKEGGR